MTALRLLSLGGVSVLMALTALAYASPPDPAWVAGVYDEADHDDVVVLIVSGSALVEPDRAVADRLAPTDRRRAPERTETRIAAPASSANLVRAPPLT
ncbi:MAG TPA: hypothetical protein VGT40_23685 [Methylomirabilota bacterium]|jgi:hypothetical protein|nr:hypothetical protein [Methylomirabilota bacterium]